MNMFDYSKVIKSLIEDKARDMVRDLKQDELDGGDPYVQGQTDEQLMKNETGFVIMVLKDDHDLDEDAVSELMELMEVKVLEG
jgi:hypothetical protein